MVDKDDIASLFIIVALFILPAIPVALLWAWLNPMGFWQNIFMLCISIPLYCIFGFFEILIIDVVS